MVTASGGPGAQFSWFQGGFVRPLLITACGEISFIKMVKLGGATLLTTCWKNTPPPPFGGGDCDCFFFPSCSIPHSFPPHLPPFSFCSFPCPSEPGVGSWVWGQPLPLSAFGFGLST